MGPMGYSVVLLYVWGSDAEHHPLSNELTSGVEPSYGYIRASAISQTRVKRPD